MKKKSISIILLVFIVLFELNAISFEYHLFELKTSPEFAEGIFPSSLLYQFNFPINPILENNKTEINFRIDNGLDFRDLRQYPDDGELLLNSTKMKDIPTNYMTFFDEMNLVFGQGFLNNKQAKDLLTLWLTIDLHIEKSYDRLTYLSNPEENKSLFFIQDPNRYLPDQKRFDDLWVGQPELIDDRQSTALSLSLGFDVNYMNNTTTTRNGITFNTWLRLNPKWFDLFHDNTQDFITTWNKCHLAYTPLSIKRNSNDNLTWFSIVLDNITTYQFTTGSKIPYYIQNGHILGTQALNASHVLTNRSAISLYGPQLYEDFYPYISFFFDVGFSAGQLLNSVNHININDTICSVGTHIELIIFNIANFYYEIGYIINDILDKPASTVSRIGFSLGI